MIDDESDLSGVFLLYSCVLSMATNLNTFLGFDKQFPEDRCLVIRQCPSFDCDGQFFIAHMLTYLKSSKKVCLLSFNQSETHFMHVASKFRVNLKSMSQRGQYQFIDGLKLIRSTSDFASFYKDLRCNVEAAIEELNSSTGDMPLIFIIDTAAALLSIENNFVAVVDFCNYCYRLVLGRENKNCLCIFSEECEEFVDDNCHRLDKSLAHRSDLIVRIKGLKSGFCRDVHGEIECFDKDTALSSWMHFKVEERVVKLFPVGCVG